MGEGIFTGLPLSLSGTRAIMERMDWGTSDYIGNKINFGKGDVPAKKHVLSSAMISAHSGSKESFRSNSVLLTDRSVIHNLLLTLHKRCINVTITAKKCRSALTSVSAYTANYAFVLTQCILSSTVFSSVSCPCFVAVLSSWC
jgi:hypothetical protein